MVIMFSNIARTAGFEPGSDGKFSLPNDQATADALAAAAVRMLPLYVPGKSDPFDVVISGAAPIWAWLCILHALHGRVRSVRYCAPGLPADGIVIFNHNYDGKSEIPNGTH